MRRHTHRIPRVSPWSRGIIRTTTLYCRFPASSGTATIPAAALAELAAGQGGFSMAAIADKPAIAGEYGIDVQAYFNAVWPDDSIVSGPTMVQ